MEIELHDYYRIIQDQNYIQLGKTNVQEIANALRSRDENRTVTMMTDEIYALLGLVLSENDIVFTPAVMATLSRHKILRLVFHVCIAADEAKHPLLDSAVRLQTIIQGGK